MAVNKIWVGCTDTNEAADRIEQLEAEVQEQCRINGMGAERELALMAKVERLERENAELKAKLESMTKVKNFIEWGGL
jgi:predicted RNase H-like nuclease (RuvC/YqgF family)